MDAGWCRRSAANGFAAAARRRWKLPARAAFPAILSCNGIGGEVKISRNRVDFGRMISTQMACAPDIMRQERQFIDTLEGARSFRLEPRRGTLELIDGRGRPAMRLRRA